MRDVFGSSGDQLSQAIRFIFGGYGIVQRLPVRREPHFFGGRPPELRIVI
jgi:hypothetical protein